MNTQSATTCPTTITGQPTTWLRLYILPPTRYVRRQRAANSPEYDYRPQAVMTDYRATSKKQSYLERGIHYFTATRKKAWSYLKKLGREVVHQLVKWCLLPLAIAACFAMVEVAPAELPEGYYTVEHTSLMER